MKYNLRPDERATLELRGLFEKFGYKKYKISKFEEYSLYATNRNFLIGDKVLTFTDLDGRLLAMKPDVIILDESTAMLDPSGRREVMNTVHRLNEEEGISVVIITHYMSEAATADYMIVMDDGKIALSGTPREVFTKVDKVRALGLDVPPMTDLAHSLRQDGVDVRADVLTVDEMVEEVCRLSSNI